MNFKDTFSTSVKSKMMANTECNPNLLIPNFYDFKPRSQSDSDSMALSNYMHILAGGRINSNQLFSFHFKPMDVSMLLFTAEGGGRISIAGESHTISDRQLIIVDCRYEFSLDSLILPWNFKLFFFTGGNTGIFKKALMPTSLWPVYTVEEFSPAIRAIDQLMRIPSEYTEKGLFTMHQAFTTLLTSAAIANVNAPAAVSTNIPSYLVELKDIFDNHYEEPFSLNTYEDTFGISKYRICKEFSAAYSISPLNYLNGRRMEIAKEMLLNTDYNIYEVSSKIGIENVNHFINLFKRSTGVTPNVFRQRAQHQLFS